jgi:hypothetical protein
VQCSHDISFHSKIFTFPNYDGYAFITLMNADLEIAARARREAGGARKLSGVAQHEVSSRTSPPSGIRSRNAIRVAKDPTPSDLKNVRAIPAERLPMPLVSNYFRANKSQAQIDFVPTLILRKISGYSLIHMFSANQAMRGRLFATRR